MKSRFFRAFCAAFALAFAPVVVVADEPPSATSDIVGFITVECLPNSDTIVSVPFHLPASHVGLIQGAPSIENDAATLTFKSGPEPLSWEAGQFGNHYVRLMAGANAGRWYEIVANAAGTITVDTNGDDLSNIAVDDQAKIIEFWTLNTLFPPDKATTAFDAEGNPNGHAIVVSASNLGPTRRSMVLIPDFSGIGTNLSAPEVYFINENTGWRKAVSGFPTGGNTVLVPDAYFIIRHPSAVAHSTDFQPNSVVESSPVSIALSTMPTGQQDNFVALSRPIPIKLKNAGLETGFMPSASNLGPARRDVLLVFDNASQSQNKSAPNQYFLVNTVDGQEWRKAVTGFPESGDDVVFLPGSGVIIRKYQNSTSETAFWDNHPSY